MGTCVLCGETGLSIEAVYEDCPNQRGLTPDEAVVEAVQRRADAVLPKPEVRRRPAREEFWTPE